MSWMPVRKRLPGENTSVLATVRDLVTKQKFMIVCTYGDFIDMETGEITKTFFIPSGDAYLSLNDNVSFRTLAWMSLPEPYKEPLYVIVAGSRTFDNYELMKQKLDVAFSARKPDKIICGEAAGADSLGKRYANEHGIPVESWPANWQKDGKQAGYLRNERMAERGTALVAFWNGTSSGTKHMIDTASAKGLQVRVIRYDQK